MNYREEYEKWLNNPNFEIEVKKELESIKNISKDINNKYKGIFPLIKTTNYFITYKEISKPFR